MRLITFLFIGTLCIMNLNQISASRILGIFTSPGKSNLKIHMAIAESLAERGHDVTVITTNKVDTKNNSLRYIQVNSVSQFPSSVVDLMSNVQQSGFATMRTFQLLTTSMAPLHNDSLNHPRVRYLMENESFDLVILGYIFNDFQLGIAAHFQCPVVVSVVIRTTWFPSNMVGQPAGLFYTPTVVSQLKAPMGFVERIKNLMYHLFEVYAVYSMNNEMEKYYRANFPPDKYPSLDEMRRNVSIVFTNHHFSEGPIFPAVPALVEVGGIQIKEKPDPLPEDVQKFLDEAKEGAIFFSFGSNYPTTKLKPHILQAIVNVFSKLKLRVLMKWENDTPPGNSQNILFRKWLPQDDVLAHPNLKLFITHGGKGSIAETQYHAVPIVGVPLFGDQIGNVKSAIDSGFGVRLDLNDINENTLMKSVKEVLDNPKYRDSIKRFSNVYRDRPMSPRETVVYWIEYVIRHRGAKHIQSPAVHMNFIQYYGLDIIGMFLAVGALFMKFFVTIVKVVRKLLSKMKSIKEKSS